MSLGGGLLNPSSCRKWHWLLLSMFLLSGDVQAQGSNLCVHHEVYEGTCKYIGKKHYILWNIHKYRDSRNNTYPSHSLKYISLNYHQVLSLRLSLSFSCLWGIWNKTWVEVVTSPIHISCRRPDILCSYCVCWRPNFPCQGRWHLRAVFFC